MYKNMKEMKWDLDDITLIPKEESDISSRSECNVLMNWGFNYLMLPLIAAPMDTVVSKNNFENFIENGIIPCLPRGQYLNPHVDAGHGNGHKPFFQSFGLCEIETQLEEYKKNNIQRNDYIAETRYAFYEYSYVLIDIANGHMAKLIPIIQDIKRYWPKIVLMVGNIANPETFINLGLAGVDFVRCGIGIGQGCTTASNVSINYPLGSLISECYEKRSHYDIKTKIVADGGMRNYSDIIKVLGAGADYVMIGSIFNKAIESAGFNYLYNIKINDKNAELLWRWGFPVKKKYRGMSTKAVQRSWGKSKLVTAEGITKYQNIEYTLAQWTENFRDYLKSAMSYCGAKNLDEFIGKAEYVFITQNALNRFKK